MEAKECDVAPSRGAKDLEAKIMKQVDETAFALRLDLAREKKLREALVAELHARGKEAKETRESTLAGEAASHSQGRAVTCSSSSAECATAASWCERRRVRRRSA